MANELQLSPEEVDKYNGLYTRALGLIEGLLLLDGHPLPMPGFFERRRLKKAVSLLEQAIAIDPASWQSMVFIGKAYQRLGEEEAALIWLLRAHDLVPEHPSVSKEAGLVASELGKHDVAFRVMQHAARLHPDDGGLQVNFGLSCLLSERVSEACEAFEHAVSIEPTVHMNKRLLYFAREVEAEKRLCPKSVAEITGSI